jgi:hypothetical protein
MINGNEADISVLDPAHSDYTKKIYYAVLPEITNLFKQGSNSIDISVADGWRNIDSSFIDKHGGERGMKFNGIKLLSAFLTLKYKNGEVENIHTGSDWQVCIDNSIESNLFDGETLDMTKSPDELKQAAIVSAPCQNMKAQALQPIRYMKEYGVKSV